MLARLRLLSVRCLHVFTVHVPSLYQKSLRLLTSPSESILVARRFEYSVPRATTIYYTFIALEGQKSILKMDNFTRPEFERIHSTINDIVTKSENTGKGRKTSRKAKDDFFMTVSTLKNDGNWSYMARMSRLMCSVSQRMINFFISHFRGTI